MHVLQHNTYYSVKEKRETNVSSFKLREAFCFVLFFTAGLPRILNKLMGIVHPYDTILG